MAVGQAQFGMVTSGLYLISARTARDPVDVVAEYPGQIEDAKKLAWRSKLQNPLLASDDTKPHGLLWMDPVVWQQMGDALKESDQIAAVPPIAEMMTDQFIAGTKLD